MVVFYRGRTVFITQEVFEVQCPAIRSYAISRLSRVHVVQLSRGSVAPKAMAIGLGSVILAAAAANGHVAGSPMWILLGSVATLASGVSAGCLKAARAYSYELRGTYQGRFVCLFSTSEERVAGQVLRALRRAVEWNRER